MTNKLYVTNISYNATASDLGKLFEQIGPVTNAAIAESEGKPLGFGFVVLADEAAARSAVDRLNNAPLLNRPIKVQLARPGSGERGREGGGGYRGRGGYDNREGGGYRGRGGYNNRDGGGYRGGGGYDNREGGGYRGGGGYDRDGGGYRGGGGYDREGGGGGYRGRGGYDREGGGGGYRGRGGYDREGGGGYRGRGGYSRGDYGGRGGWRGGRGGRGGFRPRTVINEDTPRSETQIYVGNLAWVTTVDELRDAFAEFGVKDVTIPNNKFGRALGFGLVDFNSNQGQQEALKRGKVTLHDREVVMSAAIIRQPRDEKEGDKEADQKN